MQTLLTVPQLDWSAVLHPGSSIGDGGSGPCCAKNPTQKNVPKTPPRKNRKKPENPKVKYFRNAKVKCQGQIPRSNGKPQKTGKNRF